MFQLSIFPFLAGVFVLVLAIVLAARAFHARQREKNAPFRDYFGSDYERELLQHSSLSESEDWRSDRPTRFAPLRLRDSRENKRN